MTGAINEEISVTLLTEADWQLWRSLRLLALAEAPYAFGSTLEQWSGTHDQEPRWRDRLRNAGVALVCFLGRQPAGMVATTTPTDSETELVSMWVVPELRGRGVGDRLISEVLIWANELNLAQVRLYVREMNLSAIALYERHGFVDTGERCDEMDGMCEMSMVRILDKL
ncbi:GNAT family N-acetyltransferase [Ferrimicrobium sp.]|uniref:GNAT family N-acetyltransferase n=1 Tax=Ferrimicrobium sp. TaxID=2926050 RepID=UPI0026396D16|nr:GNAT family N-acetyltransferase [Ferrimicrobium sp.]